MNIIVNRLEQKKMYDPTFSSKSPNVLILLMTVTKTSWQGHAQFFDDKSDIKTNNN